MPENLFWILEGILLIGVVCMFFDDNRGLWLGPRAQGGSDDRHREIRTGKLVVPGEET
jgi:hypothetical protein